ncbi:DNA-binding protein RHL1 isoform X2 [Punica granatum]|uniref:DNA-binding protein RHL1 isoform X2 n=1 Tax=Punica granatum TaxID=22663 RepID=A0A6P8EN42_PUNGR|nr:DNA-binding protein RHL1 isoform X2 [Punica granatum]
MTTRHAAEVFGPGPGLDLFSGRGWFRNSRKLLGQLCKFSEIHGLGVGIHFSIFSTKRFSVRSSAGENFPPSPRHKALPPPVHGGAVGYRKRDRERMVRPAKSGSSKAPNPELEERSRLKRLAFSKGMLSESAPKPQASLSPSKTVLKHHGKDIIKKTQRKNRYLFSFPGLLAPITGGKIGELKDLGTKNPILYLDFPQGQIKLFGTIIYPKNRYLTLQFSRGGKNVMCEDYFDNMIVFSDAWWIGRREDNPQEARLEFPREMIEGLHAEHDFRGGAAGSSIDKPVTNKSGGKHEAKESPETELDEEASDDDRKLKKSTEVTPVRQSERNTGKKFSYIESSPEEDSVGSDMAADVKEKISVVSADASAEIKDRSSIVAVDDTDSTDDVKRTEESRRQILSATKDEFEEASPSNHGPLVQATISALFKKAGEKVPKDLKITPPPKVSKKKSRQTDLKRKIEQDDGLKKKKRVVKGKGARAKTTRKGKELEVEDDDIEEISSSSEG